jgi:2-amino-4-hydroxy-6-hydroxymethyldihydropteridine diphosphokinase
MIRCYIALGSNLQDPASQLRRGLAAIKQLPDSALSGVSGMYLSEAVGPGDQPEYLNAVAGLDTALEPEDLLSRLQAQESIQGRTREFRWAPRTLDLDILLYGELQMRTEHLTIPHPAMAERNFVLYPLAELCGPNFVLPDGTELGTLLRDCPRGDLRLTALRFQGQGTE